MHLEFAGVNPELVGVKGLQWGQCDSQIADVVGRLSNGQNNLFTMGPEVGGAWADVQVRKVCLGSWVTDKHPVGDVDGHVLLCYRLLLLTLPTRKYYKYIIKGAALKKQSQHTTSYYSTSSVCSNRSQLLLCWRFFMMSFAKNSTIHCGH